MGVLDRFRRSAPAAASQTKHESGRGHTGGFLRYDEINPKLTGQQGIRKFAEMFRSDADVRKALVMLWAPIAAATWEVQAAGADDDTTTEEDDLHRDFIEWCLFERMTPKWSAHLWEVGRVGGRAGFVPFEMVFAKDDWVRAQSVAAPPPQVDAANPTKPVEQPKKPEPIFEKKPVVAVDALALRLPETIYRFEQEGPHLTRIWQYAQGIEGEVALDYENVLYYRFGAEGDNWEGESLLRGAYKPWKYKDTLELIDAIAHEKFRIGIPIVYPPAGGGGDKLDDAVDAISNIRANEQSYIVAPGPKQGVSGSEPGAGWLFEILQPQGSSEGASVIESLKYHKDAIAASVIEEFMRLGQSSVGARATADVQQDPFYLYCEGLAQTCVADPINEQLIPRLMGLNFDTDRMPKLKPSLIDSTSLEQLSTYVAALATPGLITPDDQLEDHLRERANLPAADPVARAKAKAQADQAALQAQQTHEAGLKNPALAPVPKPGAGAKPPPKLKVLDDGTPDDSFLRHMDVEQTARRLDAARLEVERLTSMHAKELAAGETPQVFLDAIEEHYRALEAHGEASVEAELASQDGDPVTLDFDPAQARDEVGRWTTGAGGGGIFPGGIEPHAHEAHDPNPASAGQVDEEIGSMLDGLGEELGFYDQAALSTASDQTISRLWAVEKALGRPPHPSLDAEVKRRGLAP